MKIMKFGGTSVGRPERMHQVADLVLSQTEPKIVVLSALSGTTNELVKISTFLSKRDRNSAKSCIDELEKHYRQFVLELLDETSSRSEANSILSEHFDFLNIILKISYSDALDKDILAQGELMSTKLFSVYLKEKKVDHVLLPALEYMSIRPDSEPDFESIRLNLTRLLAGYPETTLFVTQGYICKNSKGEVDNLKRGGSDYTASLIAAAIHASVCEIWTDIDGMHNNDPRIVDKTYAIEQLSFEEAAELAYFGAKILHPTCIWPAQQENVPVKLLNTMEPEAVGTTITELAGSLGIKAVAAKDNIIVLKIKSTRMLLAYGFLKRVFEIFEKYHTSVDMVTTSEVAVSLTIDESTYLEDIVRELKPIGNLEIKKDQTIISIVGNELAGTDKILNTFFSAVADIPITMVSYGASPHNISVLVDRSYKEKMLSLINNRLFGL